MVYFQSMAKKKDSDFEESDDKLALADRLGEEMISSRQFEPLPGESMMDLWTRLSAKALQLTMTRAALGDRQALSTVYEMVKAPVLVETQMMELETKNGKLRSVSGGSKGQQLLNSATAALIDGTVTTARKQ
jgi:hypothetical protein